MSTTIDLFCLFWKFIYMESYDIYFFFCLWNLAQFSFCKIHPFCCMCHCSIVFLLYNSIFIFLLYYEYSFELFPVLCYNKQSYYEHPCTCILLNQYIYSHWKIMVFMGHRVYLCWNYCQPGIQRGYTNKFSLQPTTPCSCQHLKHLACILPIVLSVLW